MDLLTASRIKAFRRCPRLHHLRYGLGYQPATDAEALRFGTLLHRGLEAWWRGAGDERLEAAADAVRQPGVDPFDLVRAEELLLGYHIRWREEQIETVAVEQEFRAPLINPATGHASHTFDLAGKLDAVARDTHGRVYIVEHKTTSEEIGTGSTYWQRLRMDGQIGQYFAGARALGYDPEGCLYDVIKKPGLRPYQPGKTRRFAETPDEFRIRLRDDIAEDPDRYYQRAPVVRLESEIAEYATDVWDTAQLIRAAQLAARSPKYADRRLPLAGAPKNPDGCFPFGSGHPCSFFPVCSGAASLDDESRYRHADSVHPELSQEAA